jgi:hypothetical protein
VGEVMAGLQTLQILGSFGLEVSLAFPAYTYQDENGYGFHQRTGHADGTKRWRLIYEATPDDFSCETITINGVTITAREYIRAFFINHHKPNIIPFQLVCPDDGVLYSAVFTEHTINWRYLEYKLWGTGLALKQWRRRGGSVEQVNQPNPLSI